MGPWINLVLLTIVCVLGVGHGFAPRSKLADPHIIGGKEVDIKEVPYMVSIRSLFGHKCGGSIVGKYHVLTAAHCFRRSKTAFHSVTAGCSQNEGGLHFDVENLIEHPKFSIESYFDYDVAVLRIGRGFNFDAQIAPIVPVDIHSPVDPNNALIVAGWGLISPNSQRSSDNLMKTEVYYIDQLKCKELYLDQLLVTKRMFCAGVAKGGHDSSKGDSGGPIVDSKSGRQVGIVSWGFGRGEPERPGVYTKLSDPEIWNFVDVNTKK